MSKNSYRKAHHVILKKTAPFIILLLCFCLAGCNSCGDTKSWSDYLFPVIGDVNLAQDAPWPMWQHDPSHTGRSPFNGPTSVTAATYDTPLCCFGIFGSPVIDAGSHVFVGSIRSAGDTLTCDFFANPEEGASGLLHGIDYDGAVLEGFPYDSHRGSVMATAIECAPIILDDGSVIFGKDDGYMYRVGNDGSLVWESPSDDPFDSSDPVNDNEQMIPSPLLGADNTVVFLSHFSDVYGPGPTADAVAFACPDLDPFPFKGTASQWYSKIYALDARTGWRKWVFDPEDDPASGGQPMVGWGSPALGPDGSYIICLMHAQLAGDHYVPTTGRVFAIGPDGSRRWVYPAEGEGPLDYSLWTSPVISPSGYIYVGASDYTYTTKVARLYSLTPEGALRWYYDFTDENTIAASPSLLSDGTIIVATQNRSTALPSLPAGKYGRIYALTDYGDHADEQWRYPAAGTVPWGFYSSPLVDASGHIYIASEPFSFGGAETGVLIGLESDGDLMFSVALDGVVHGNLALGSDGALVVPQRKSPRLLVFY
ncbi:MAG: PQQ-like beta-propeller repeat protein [Spirochaetes bacterium]|nr:PQQ-like beta-propeller repeat protein [Spirochaetota bacterium]